MDFSNIANSWFMICFRFAPIKCHQLEECIIFTKARVSLLQNSPVQPLFLSKTGVPKALPCPRETQPQGRSARAQLIAHLLSRLPPGLPSHSLIQPASQPATQHTFNHLFCSQMAKAGHKKSTFNRRISNLRI